MMRQTEINSKTIIVLHIKSPDECGDNARRESACASINASKTKVKADELVNALLFHLDSSQTNKNVYRDLSIRFFVK